MRCTKREPSDSRVTSIVARTGPRSRMRTLAGPETYERGGFLRSFQSMFHAGNCAGFSYRNASRAGADNVSRLFRLSKTEAMSPASLSVTRRFVFSNVVLETFNSPL